MIEKLIFILLKDKTHNTYVFKKVYFKFYLFFAVGLTWNIFLYHL